MFNAIICQELTSCYKKIRKVIPTRDDNKLFLHSGLNKQLISYFKIFKFYILITRSTLLYAPLKLISRLEQKKVREHPQHLRFESRPFLASSLFFPEP